MPKRMGLAEAPFVVFKIEDLMAMGERNLIPVLLHLFRPLERSLKGQPASHRRSSEFLDDRKCFL
jgi:type IV secretion system protein TrbE